MQISSSFLLDNKVAIITGASKGIGKSIAKALGQQGAKLVLVSRKQEAVDAVAAEFKKEGIESVAIAANMGNMSQVKTIIEGANTAFGGVDIVVNNAAINPVFGPIIETDLVAYEKIMDVNVKGPLELCKLAYPILKKRAGGSIINISSVEGLTPAFGLGLYSISKAALIASTKVLAKEWGVDNIRANVICPGLVKTKFSEVLTSNDKIVKMVMHKQALQHLADPIDIAGLALFLASNASSFCTGSVYTADGGFTI